MFRWLVTTALVGSLVGCGPATMVEAPDKPILVIEPSASRLPTTSKRSRHDTPRCVVSHDDFAATGQRWRLILDGDGDDSVWAMLDPEEGGRAAVHLEGVHDEDSVVTFDGGGFELDTLAMSADIHFYGGEPIWLQGVVLPDPMAELALERADGERVTLALEVGDDFVPPRVVDQAACGALAMAPGDYDVAGLTRLADQKTFEIVGDEPVPLFAAPEGGRSGLALALGAGTRLVAGPREGTRRQVRLPRRYRFTVMGWVPADRLLLPPGIHGWGSTGGRGVGRRRRGRTAIHAHRRHYRCPSRVPLWVILGGRRQRVGALAPKRDFFAKLPLRPQDELQPILFEEAPIAPQNGARLAVPTRALSGCEAQ